MENLSDSQGIHGQLEQRKESRPEGGHQIRIYIDLIGPL